MDAGPEAARHDPVVVTGAGHVLGVPCDPAPYMKVRKNRKFMGPQDDLAVAAAGRAIEAAGLAGAPLGERGGLYLAVGHIPFEREPADVLLRSSLDHDGRFSMARFSTQAFGALNPLLTFRCLSNMPAFHVSVNFDVQGPYLVTYPGPGQLYVALEEAVAALSAGSIDVALVAGVTYQRNFLVEHHFSRIDPPVPLDRLRDTAGCMVLERAERGGSRALGRLLGFGIAYDPPHPMEESRAQEERAAGASLPDGELGPASLPVLLSQNLGRRLLHEVASRDGVRAWSAWGPA